MREPLKDGQILIAPRVLAKIEAHVEVEALREFTLKGFHRPVHAYNVLRGRIVVLGSKMTAGDDTISE